MILGKVILKPDGSKKLEIINLKLYEKTVRSFKEGSMVDIDIRRKKKESKAQRGYYFGGVLSIWAYLNDMDWKDKGTIDDLHEIAKQQWNGKLIVEGGKTHKIGQTTRQGAIGGVIEGVIQHLEDEYGIKRQECLDPAQYEYWNDAIRSTGEYDWYISYLAAIGKLPKK